MSPYGKTTTVGLGDFNPLRHLPSWQETTSTGAPGHYKLGARFYKVIAAMAGGAVVCASGIVLTAKLGYNPLSDGRDAE